MSQNNPSVGQYWWRVCKGQTLQVREMFCILSVGLLNMDVLLTSCDLGTDVLVYGFPGQDGEWVQSVIQPGQEWTHISSPCVRIRIEKWLTDARAWDVNYIEDGLDSGLETFSEAGITMNYRLNDGRPLKTPVYHLPEKCNRCGSPAYISFREVECSNTSCFCYVAPQPIGEVDVVPRQSTPNPASTRPSLLSKPPLGKWPPGFLITPKP